MFYLLVYVRPPTDITDVIRMPGICAMNNEIAWLYFRVLMFCAIFTLTLCDFIFLGVCTAHV